MNRAQRRAAARFEGRRPGRRAAALGSAAVLATAGGAAAVMLAGATPAGANAPIVVDSLTDDGTGTTLREAIAQANTDVGEDTITFSVTGTITIASDLPDIEKGLHIQGPGAGSLTVDGGGAYQIFTFFGIATDEGDSSVSGLTLTGGLAAPGDWGQAGGAIVKAYNNGTLAIADCVITGNAAVRGGGVALYDTRGDVTITNTVFSDNYAAQVGGGLSVSDNDPGHELHLIVTGSSFTDNDAADPVTARGGGIWARRAVVDLTDTDVSANYSGRAAGGVWLYDVEATLTRVTVDDNEAHYGVGGGMEANTSTVAITDSSVSDNVAAYGGGGLYFGSSTVVVSGSTIAGNEAGLYGGGFYLDVDSVSTTIVNSTISSNTALNGGGIFAGRSPAQVLEITQSTVTGNTATVPVGVGGIVISEDLLADVSGTKSVVGDIVAGNNGFDLWANAATPATVLTSGSVLGRVGATVAVVDAGGTQTGVTAEALRLGPLADNGGPTLTHALLPGSVAIDAGPVPPATFPGDAWDQRGKGYARVVAGRADVGAFEVQAEPVPEPTFTG